MQPTAEDEDYWESSGLRATFDGLPAGADGTALAPDVNDLVRLHRLVRERPCVTVLEFGIGCSTIALAHALAENEREHGEAVRARVTRNSQLFQLFSVDANEGWIEHTRARLPASLADRVHLSHSPVSATTFGGRLCHAYDALPDVVPDMIYLDGPDPADVRGSVGGLSFSIPERTVMAADILLMEPTLLPGTVVVVDGRESNVRFLLNNLQRPFALTREGDATILELDEPRLGSVDVIGVDVFGRPGQRPGE
jgi:Methyltransferase domain